MLAVKYSLGYVGVHVGRCMMRLDIGSGLRTIAVSGLVLLLASASADADTLPGALALAYENNPQLNAQRTAVRVTDEAVPQALSGYRPRVSLSASIGEQYLDTLSKSTFLGSSTYTHTEGTNTVQSYGGTVTQNLFNGFQTARWILK